jgi:hypothetical protein
MMVDSDESSSTSVTIITRLMRSALMAIIQLCCKLLIFLLYYSESLPQRKHVSPERSSFRKHRTSLRPPLCFIHDASCRAQTDAAASASTLASTALTRITPRFSPYESSRIAMVKVIEDSWQKVSNLIGSATLTLCEQELKSATSMLVLATIKRLADENPSAKETIDAMLREADVNQDGQLTFIEWQNWLGRRSDSSDDGAISAKDPVTAALSVVLGHAISTLKVSTRLSQDPALLTASFIGGGISSGVIDGTLSQALLSRIQPALRETVTMALTLEAASFASSSSSIRTAVIATAIDSDPAPKDSYIRRQDSGEASAMDFAITTVDLSSIPVLVAPPIDDFVVSEPLIETIPTADAVSRIIAAGADDRLEDLPSSASAEVSLVKYDYSNQGGLNQETKNLLGLEMDTTIAELSRVWDDILALRSSLRDLDDGQAKRMREVSFSVSYLSPS